MQDLPIDLGMSYGSDFGGAVAFPKASEPEKFFPSTRLEWTSDYELPDEGTITFKYRVTRSVEEKKAGKFSEEIEFLKIVDVKGHAKKSEEYSGDVIDRIKGEVLEAIEGD